MELKRFVVGVGDVNCYILSDDNKVGVIVDPGDDGDKLIDYIEKEGIELKAIILTHYHYDHILALEEVRDRFNIPVLIHKEDFEGLNNPEINLSANRPVGSVSVEADKTLEDGEILNFGEMRLEIIHTPGHTGGCICIKIHNILLTGDTLFKNSLGRTDLVGGSYERLVESVKGKLLTLDDDIVVYPGHYDQSTLGVERRNNPKIQRILKEFC
ncbi:MBL fold metallo-hydrolase [Halonatronum saccharophilum]|uniref:MBL fold metallo-hydrolase n=1 Tax=Halonatronum saccharophilum TaxID=150060 RepID=UPI000488AD26|nr:MBL fold metallo-hydrolase [Halonatronum saccharophilum]